MRRPLRSMRLGWVLSVAIVAIVATAAPAGERTHLVRGGESASTIADQHYGNYELGWLLLQYNEKPSTVIRVGETLRVPFSEIHRVQSGDSWSKLAQRYLGSAMAYPTIAALNDLPVERPLQVGTEIVMPVVLPHRLARGETLNELASSFYGDESKHDVLRSFNGIDDPRRLSVGQSIAVPLVTMRLRDDLHAKVFVAEQAAPREVEVLEEPEPVPEKPAALFVEELGTASDAFEEGDYATARELLESLIEAVASKGSDTEKADLGRLLAFTYVAFDLPDEACAAYRSIGGAPLAQSPLEERVSPKIRRTLADCNEVSDPS